MLEIAKNEKHGGTWYTCLYLEEILLVSYAFHLEITKNSPLLEFLTYNIICKRI